MRRKKGKVIVFGILFWYPLAGVTYQFLHYLLGLRRLGYDVYYVEDSARLVYDPKTNDLSEDPTGNIQAVTPLLRAFGLGDRWAFRGGGRCYGMDESQLLQLYREADAFLNVTGAQEIREEHRQVKRRIYVQTDPVAAQVKVVQGDAETIAMLEAHDTHFTYGENLGAADCGVPVERYNWLPTRQPVVCDLWSNPAGEATAWNTICTWQNKGKDITYNGETYYWSKDREFAKFEDLPLLRRGPFELATDIGRGAFEPMARRGWRYASSFAISGDLDLYRKFITCSRGEFTVAKDQNIRLRSGWFSDRGACYLAAGRPVINQDTAFGNVLPTGRGLFSFRTLDDACAAIDAVESHYEDNCRAARDIAHEYFDAEKVLARLMERANV